MSTVTPRAYRPELTGRRRPARTAAASVVLAALAVVGAATAASAHVTVVADDARQGANDSVLTFRIPDEDATASTVKIAISFPKTTPLASVKPAAKPGWTFATTKSTFEKPIKTDDGTITEGVTEVVYTASSAAAGIPAGGFDTFQILVGPMPDTAASLAFPTVQTYSTGRSVAWVQPVTDPTKEPENPAPLLQLQPATAVGASAGSAGSGASPDPMAGMDMPGSASAAASPAAGASDHGDMSGYATTGDLRTARQVAVVATVLAALGLLAGLGGVLLARRRVALPPAAPDREPAGAARTCGCTFSDG